MMRNPGALQQFGRIGEQQGHCSSRWSSLRQPILRRFGVESTLRATLALYNTFEDIDTLIAALWELRQGRNPGLA
jgi:cysteine desulfurase / selenocysteine lyase